MGYYSQVKYTIVGPEAAMTAALVQFRLTHQFAPEDNPLNPDRMRISKCGDQLVIHFEVDSWKWYDGFPDSDAHRALWDFFDGLEDENITGQFVRLGENDDDVETKEIGYPDGLVEVERSIHSHYDFSMMVDIREPEPLSSTIE